MPTMKSLGLDTLNREERLNLVEEIWDSISEEMGDVPLTDTQLCDLKERLDRYEANPSLGSSWDEVKSRLMAE